jgi:hypothetical protein
MKVHQEVVRPQGVDAAGRPLQPGGRTAPLLSAVAASGAGPPISRRDIVARARTWLDVRVPYGRQVSRDGYRTDCSGYVSMAWHTSRNHWTGDLNTIGVPIRYEDLRPGDMLLRHDADDPVRGSHVVLFDHWSGPVGGDFVVYEQTPPATGRRAWSSLGYRRDRFQPYRYVNVLEDPVVAPIAAVTREHGLDVFWRTADGGLGHARSDRYGWHGPTVLEDARPMASPPTAAVTADGVVDVFWAGTEGRLRHKRFDGAGRRPASGIRAGNLGSAPRAVGHSDGRIEVFWRGTDGGLWRVWSYDGSEWYGPQYMVAGILGSDPFPLVSGRGMTRVFWKGGNGNLWCKWTADGGTVWNGPDNLGMGVLGSAPVAAGRSDGAADVFWTGSDGGLWRAATAGRIWTGPRAMATGVVAAEPAPTVSSRGTVSLFWQGSDGGLWHLWSSDAGRTWHGPDSLGMGRLGSPPVAAGRPDGTVDVLWRGTDAALWHARYRDGWTGPHRLGGTIG